MPDGRLAAVPDELIVVAGRLVVTDPALLMVPDAGAVTVPDGRLAAVAWSLIVGVVLVTDDLPAAVLFVSEPLDVVTRVGTALPDVGWVLVVVPEATVLFLLIVLRLPIPPLRELLPANTLSEPVS